MSSRWSNKNVTQKSVLEFDLPPLNTIPVENAFSVAARVYLCIAVQSAERAISAVLYQLPRQRSWTGTSMFVIGPGSSRRCFRASANRRRAPGDPRTPRQTGSGCQGRPRDPEFSELFVEEWLPCRRRSVNRQLSYRSQQPIKVANETYWAYISCLQKCLNFTQFTVSPVSTLMT